MERTAMPGSHVGKGSTRSTVEGWKSGVELTTQAVFLTTNVHRMKSVFETRRDKVT